jgi:hypothetical protein
VFDCSLPLAAMFAGFAAVFVRAAGTGSMFGPLLLHTARRWDWCSLRSRNLF